jgi:hypothetical protein
MRLNFSHATVEEADLRMTNLRASSGRNGDTSGMGADDDVLRRGCVGVVGSGRNMRASLLDTRGPEIRTLKVENDTSGKETLTLTKGEEVGVESDVTGKMECKKGKFYVNYAGIEKVRGDAMDSERQSDKWSAKRQMKHKTATKQARNIDEPREWPKGSRPSLSGR